MKINIKKQPLVSTLSALQFLTKNQTTVPALSCFLVRVDKNNGADVVVTDGNSFLVEKVEADIVNDGCFAFPAKKLLDITRSIDSDDISIEVNDDLKATIKGDKSTFSLIVYKGEEFPPIPNVSGESFNIDGSIVSNLIKSTIFSVCTDNSRPVLSGLSIKVGLNKINIASSDGRRLSINSADIDYDSNNLSAIIPTGTANNFLRLLEGLDNVQLTVQENLIKFDVNYGNTVFISNLLDFIFPNLDNVIPKSFDTKIEVNRAALLSLLKRAEIVAPEKAQSVKMTWKKNSLNIFASTPAVGDFNEDLDIEYNGMPLTIYFSPIYFAEALNVIDAKEVTLCFGDESSPMMIEAGSFKHILMPMRYT